MAKVRTVYRGMRADGMGGGRRIPTSGYLTNKEEADKSSKKAGNYAEPTVEYDVIEDGGVYYLLRSPNPIDVT